MFPFISYFYEFSNSIVYLSQPLFLYVLLLYTARKNNVANQIFSLHCQNIIMFCLDFTKSLTNEFEDKF